MNITKLSVISSFRALHFGFKKTVNENETIRLDLKVIHSSAHLTGADPLPHLPDTEDSFRIYVEFGAGGVLTC